MKIINVIKIARPQQWYKNFLVFLPLIFVGQLFDFELIKLAIQAFASLCLVSSSNYIINDIIDLKKDQLNPEKKTRPLAAGMMKKWQAIIEAIILLSLGLWTAYPLGKYFFASTLFLFAFTQMYSLVLKKEIFLDILAIATNFVVRAIAGAFAINVKLSPWLILCPFFLSLYLSVGKRHSELTFLGEEAQKHRATLGQYTKEITQALMIISTTLLIVSYSLYSFLSEHKHLLITLPFALYVIFRYFYLIQTGSEIARHPDLVIFRDWRIDLGVLLWVLSVIVIIYLPAFLR